MAEFSHWFIAGYENAQGEWQDTEKGDPDPSDEDWEDGMYQTVIGIVDNDGEPHYYTVWGGFDEDFTPEDVADYLSDTYAGEFA